MNDKLIAAGSFIFEQYLKPVPKVAFKAILASWIGTTAGLAISWVILQFKNRETI